MLLSEAFERYRQDRVIFANKSVKTEEGYIYTEKALLKFTGDMELSALTFEHLRHWSANMRKRGLTSGTIRGYIVCTRAVLGYMQVLKHECLDPKLVVIPERIDPTPEFLTPPEVSQLIRLAGRPQRGCSPAMKARNQAIIALLYSSGIRASELCSLDRKDIQGEVFTVLGKGGKRRPCMVDVRAQKLLRAYLSLRTDAHPALFVDNGFGINRIRPNTLQALFRRLSRHFGRRVHPHTLRHSLANDLMRKGCHIYPLSRIMGHSSIATTQTYFQLFDPELLEVHKKYHTV